jgi:hypothetical protein
MVSMLTDSKNRVKAYGNAYEILQSLDPALISRAQDNLARGIMVPILPNNLYFVPVSRGGRR